MWLTDISDWKLNTAAGLIVFVVYFDLVMKPNRVTCIRKCLVAVV